MLRGRCGALYSARSQRSFMGANSPFTGRYAPRGWRPIGGMLSRLLASNIALTRVLPLSLCPLSSYSILLFLVRGRASRMATSPCVWPTVVSRSFYATVRGGPRPERSVWCGRRDVTIIVPRAVFGHSRHLFELCRHPGWDVLFRTHDPIARFLSPAARRINQLATFSLCIRVDIAQERMPICRLSHLGARSPFV